MPGVRIENDKTRDSRPAVIMTGVRTGGTFLAHCLSSHPQVFCDRGESLHQNSIWHQTMTVESEKLLHCLTHMQGYRVSVCKLTYYQAFRPKVWKYLVETRPPVIWLRRENYIRQAVSVLLNSFARDGKIKRPQHSFESVAPAGVVIDPEHVLRCARRMAALDQNARARLEGWPRRLDLTYAELVGGEGCAPDRPPERTQQRICEWLDVPLTPLTCELKRINEGPLSVILSNWSEVAALLRQSEFADLLEE